MASSSVQNDFIEGLPQWPGLILEVSETNDVIRESPLINEVIRKRIERTGVLSEISYRGEVTRTIRRDPIGHYFCYQFNVPNRRQNATMGFQASCDIPCPPLLTTSWLCEMVFGKVEDNSTCIIFKLKRTDSNTDFAVNVLVALDIRNVTTELLFRKVSTSRHAMKSGQQIDGHLIKSFKTPEEAGYYKMLFVKVEVRVLCHDELAFHEKIWEGWGSFRHY